MPAATNTGGAVVHAPHERRRVRIVGREVAVRLIAHDRVGIDGAAFPPVFFADVMHLHHEFSVAGDVGFVLLHLRPLPVQRLVRWVSTTYGARRRRVCLLRSIRQLPTNQSVNRAAGADRNHPLGL